MKKNIKLRLVVFSAILVTTVVAIQFHFGNDNLLSETCIGEGEHWSVSLNYEEIYDEAGRLNSSSEYILYYKGDSKDLASIKKIRVKSPFDDIGMGSSSGFREDNMRIGSGGTGLAKLKKRKLEKFEVTVYWVKEETLQETIELYLQTVPSKSSS